MVEPGGVRVSPPARRVNVVTAGAYEVGPDEEEEGFEYDEARRRG
ncbi:hypothetical protein [Methylobacterium sp. J-072]|nr:hypothetical protein [Methylobacterium sp. J-072]